MKWAEDSRAAGTAAAAKGEFQQWAQSGVRLLTQGQRMETTQLHYARPAASAFSGVPRKTQAGLCKTVKVCVAISGYLSTTIKLLQL